MGHPVHKLPGARPTSEFEAGPASSGIGIEASSELGFHTPVERLMWEDGRFSHMAVWEGNYQRILPVDHNDRLPRRGTHKGIDVGTLLVRVCERITELHERSHLEEDTQPLSWDEFCDFINAEENQEDREAISLLRGVKLVFGAATDAGLSKGWIMSIFAYAKERATITRSTED